jgi:Phage tail tube protein
MTLSARKIGILAKLETVAGTDSVPTPANDAVLVSALPDLAPLIAEYEERDLRRPYFGSAESILTKTSTSLGVQVEMQSSGTLGTAPAMRALLRAAGFTETINAGVSVVYTPTSTNIPTLTAYAYMDAILHKIVNAMANMTINVNAGAVPQFNFSLTGKYVPPIDGVLTAPDYTKWKLPLAANSTNTTATLGGIAVCVQSFSYDQGNQVLFEDLIGCSSSSITNRAASGSIVIEAVDVATKDWWDIIAANQSVPFVLTHGTVAGSIVQIEIPAFAIQSPSYTESNNKLFHGFDYKAVPIVGNDEIKITFL